MCIDKRIYNVYIYKVHHLLNHVFKDCNRFIKIFSVRLKGPPNTRIARYEVGFLEIKQETNFVTKFWEMSNLRIHYKLQHMESFDFHN